MKINQLIYPIILILFVYPLYSRNPQTDSIKNLANNSSGLEKAKYLFQLSKAYRHKSPREGISVARQALQMPSLKQNDTLRVWFYYELGFNYHTLGILDSAKLYGKKMDAISDSLNEPSLQSMSNSILGLIYWKMDDYPKAITHAQERLKYTRKEENKNGLGIGYNNLGIIYYDMSDYDRAMENYYKYLQISEEIDNLHGIALASINLGEVYMNLDSLDKAIDHIYRGLDIFIKQNQKNYTAYSYQMIGKIYKKKQDYVKSEEYIQKSLELKHELGIKDGEARSYLELGNLAYAKGKPKKAVQYYKDALNIFQKIKDKNDEAQSLILLARTYRSGKRYKLARQSAVSASNIAESIGAKKLLRDSYKQLYLIEEEKGNISEALNFYKKYDAWEDSVYSAKNADNIVKWQTLYETNKKEKEIEILKTKQKLQKTQIQKQNLLLKIFIGGSAIILLILFLIYRLYHLKRKTNKKLKYHNDQILEKNKEIEQQSKELSEANEALKKLSIVASKTDNLVIIADINEKIEWVNAALYKLYGYKTEKFLGKNIFEISTHGDIDKIKEKFYEKKKSINYESHIVSASGKKYYLQTTITPIFSPNGEIDKIIAVDSDITRQKQIENDLKEKQQELEKANATKDKFFSIIAHDLKNPFNQLIGISNLLRNKSNKMKPSKIQYFHEALHETSQQGYELLSNLLHWSRSQLNRIEMNPVPVNLAQLTEETIKMQQSRAKEKGIQLSIDIHEDISIEADYNMITTVIRNLINNALKFTPRGGWVQFQTLLENNKVKLLIRDNGVGIPEEKQKKLFRIDQSYSTQGTDNEKGTGLGLILCKEFIEKHGSQIHLESKENKGTTFAFTLPRSF